MVLSDEGIKKALESGDLVIDPLPRDDQYSPSAVDIYLGDSFKIWDPKLFTPKGLTQILDLSEQTYQDTANSYTIEAPREADRSVILPPYFKKPQVLLGMTRERIHLKKHAALAARVEGRSSLARSGLLVHLTAPTIHSGFDGQITLEIINYGPFHMKFIPNQTRICQFIIERLDSVAAGDIQTAFQGQTDPVSGHD